MIGFVVRNSIEQIVIMTWKTQDCLYYLCCTASYPIFSSLKKQILSYSLHGWGTQAWLSKVFLTSGFSRGCSQGSHCSHHKAFLREDPLPSQSHDCWNVSKDPFPSSLVWLLAASGPHWLSAKTLVCCHMAPPQGSIQHGIGFFSLPPHPSSPSKGSGREKDWEKDRVREQESFGYQFHI